MGSGLKQRCSALFDSGPGSVPIHSHSTILRAAGHYSDASRCFDRESFSYLAADAGDVRPRLGGGQHYLPDGTRKTRKKHLPNESPDLLAGKTFRIPWADLETRYTLPTGRNCLRRTVQVRGLERAQAHETLLHAERDFLLVFPGNDAKTGTFR